ncbi:VTT domain-containing protein [Streptococcus sp. H49]|uniref:VTT domain-containing protein n=1 Tax=Streptococcus huangxiaojuni TaxID=3237239 RepID=UPI0034A5595D
MSYHTWQRIFKLIGWLSLFVTVAFLVYLFKGLNILNNPDALTKLLQERLLLGALLFFLLQIIQVVIPIIPGGVTTVVGFLAFGPVLGFILNYLGIVIGSVILFALTRHFGRKFIFLFVTEKQFHHYEKMLFTPTYEKFFILNMLSPVSPADIMVMVTGLTSMSYSRFIRIILLCKPFSIVAYGYFWIYGGRLLKKLL